jgi:hypothetical protein
MTDIYKKKGMKFGILKSKIDGKLLESYSKGNFKSELNKFKEIVLSDKNLSKLYFYYDELSSKKGLSENQSNDFINDVVNEIKSLNVNENNLKSLKTWLRGSKIQNKYRLIDEVISENVDFSKKIELKSKLSNTLMQKEKSLNSPTNLPLQSMVNVANQTLQKHFETLNESDKKELNEILNLSDSELVKSFKTNLKEVTEKLNSYFANSQDEQEKIKISETINSIKSKEINKLELYKLSKLNSSL